MKGLRLVKRASSARGTGRSRLASMWVRILSSGLGWVERGWQRLQGRNPAACAAWAVGKKRTLVLRGRLLVQVGRQKTPVVVTA